MKRRKLVLSMAFLLLVSGTGCEYAENALKSEQIPVTLTNTMTQEERSRITVGACSLLAAPEETDTHLVRAELWDNEDYLQWTKENKELYTETEYQEAIEFYETNEFTSIHGIVIDGRYYNGFLPPYGYDGGKLSYWVSSGITITEGEDEGKTVSSEPEEVRLADFAAFQEWYRDYVDKEAADGYYSQEQADQTYADMLVIFQSVMDGTYEILDEPAENFITSTDFRNVWEFDPEAAMEIADHVTEISMYDAQLDTTFLIHVTLPPTYDESKSYPMFLMTDGVWRFGDHPALYEMMETGETDDVILVSIGYDFSLDGTDNAVRAKYFCENKDLFLDFITDDLTPYLHEQYEIDFEKSALYGHSLGGVFTHYAAFHSDLYENQPFQYYIIGSPAFWSPYFLPTESNPDAHRSEYGYFERNTAFSKNLYICGGENEDADYAEYYGDNPSTLEGISQLMERLEKHGVTTAVCEIYEDSNHYEFIPAMFRAFFLEYYQ